MRASTRDVVFIYLLFGTGQDGCPLAPLWPAPHLFLFLSISAQSFLLLSGFHVLRGLVTLLEGLSVLLVVSQDFLNAFCGPCSSGAFWSITCLTISISVPIPWPPVASSSCLH